MSRRKGIRFLRQPTAVTCGQTCVAMLADVSVDEACAAVGTRGKTSTKQIITGLRKLGLTCGDKRIRHKPPHCIPNHLPNRLLLVNVSLIRYKKVAWRHWAVWHGGWYFDPETRVWLEKPRHWVEADAHVRSYLEVDVPRLRKFYA